MASAEASTTFAEATTVKPLSSQEYEADFPNDWCIGTGEKGIYFCVDIHVQSAPEV